MNRIAERIPMDAGGEAKPLRLSVIIPLYNSMPYFKKTVSSILDQKGGLDGVEVIIVDDKSTDSGRRYARKLQRKYPDLIKLSCLKANSGPSHARNIGLQMARGKYVIFCDADDYFGLEAFSKMLRHADEWGSDILYLKRAGVAGRTAPSSMFYIDQRRVDIFKSTAFNSLTCFKLFRRDFIEALGLRFFEDCNIDEDRLFVSSALFATKSISIASDYCYGYFVKRDDGKNLSERPFSFSEKSIALDRMLKAAAHASNRGNIDEVIIPRILSSLWTASLLGAASLPEAERYSAVEKLRGICQPYASPGAVGRLPAALSILFQAFAEGECAFLFAFLADIDFMADGTYQGYEMNWRDIRVKDGCAYLEIERCGRRIKADASRDMPFDYRIVRAERGKDSLVVEGHIRTNEFWGSGASVGILAGIRGNDEMNECPTLCSYSQVDGLMRWKASVNPLVFDQTGKMLGLYIRVSDGELSKTARFGAKMNRGLRSRIAGSYWLDDASRRFSAAIIDARGNICFSEKPMAEYLLSSFEVAGSKLSLRGILENQEYWDQSTTISFILRGSGQPAREVRFPALLQIETPRSPWNVAIDFEKLNACPDGVWEFFFEVKSSQCSRRKRFGSEITDFQRDAMARCRIIVSDGTNYKPVFTEMGNISYTKNDTECP